MSNINFDDLKHMEIYICSKNSWITTKNLPNIVLGMVVDKRVKISELQAEIISNYCSNIMINLGVLVDSLEEPKRKSS